MKNNLIRILILFFLILGVWPNHTQAAGEGSITITVTIKEAVSQAGVTIRLIPRSKRARAGQTVSLRARIRNTGDGDDYFTLDAFSSLGWSVDFPQGNTIGPIKPRRRKVILLKVIVPPDAESGDRNVLTVTATSQSDPSVSDSSSSTIIVTKTGQFPYTSTFFGGSWFLMPGSK